MSPDSRDAFLFTYKQAAVSFSFSRWNHVLFVGNKKIEEKSESDRINSDITVALINQNMGGINSKDEDAGLISEKQAAQELTVEEKDAIRASWSVIEKVQKEIGIAFFVKFFTDFPEYLKLFSRLRKVNADDLPNNKALHAHAATFMRFMGSLVESADDFDCIDELLYKIAVRHQPFGLKAKDFFNATDLYVSTLHPNPAFDGLEHSSEFIAASWKHAFDIVLPVTARYMEDLEKEAADAGAADTN